MISTTKVQNSIKLSPHTQHMTATFSGNIVQNKTWLVRTDGTLDNPGVSFFGSRDSGFSRSSNVDVSIQGVYVAAIHADGLIVDDTLTCTNMLGNASGLTSPAPQISNIQVANSTYDVQDDTAVSSEDGGFLVVNGTNFGPGTFVTIGATQASSVTFVSTSKLHVQVPAKASGSYTLEATRLDGKVATVPLGVTYSPFPVWSTPAILGNVTKYTTFTQMLSATESAGSHITYTVSGSLPPGTTLAANGQFAGNIVSDIGNTTTYSFTIQAIDAQLQDVPRTFGLTAFGGAPLALSGLVGWYDGFSWTGTQWTDKSGSGNHAVTIRGTIGTSSVNGLPILTGATTAGIRFPAAILPATYTLFHVARYSGGTRGRILDGVTNNWLSGFHGGTSGVAYHNAWLTQNVMSVHNDTWVLSTDQNDLYRSNFKRRSVANGGSTSYDVLSVNYNTARSQYSDWHVAEVLVYNRTLNLGEIQSIEWYLAQRYALNTSIPTDGLVTYLDANNVSSWPGSGTIWYDLSGSGRNGTWSAVSTGTSTSGHTYFNTNGYRCTGVASNAYGITDTSGFTVFISYYVNALTQNLAFYWFSSSATSARGISAHVPWTDGILYYDTVGRRTTYTTPTTGRTGVWHTLAVVRTSGSSPVQYLYYDGILQGTNATTGNPLLFTSTPAALVNSAAESNSTWNARVSSVAVYNRDLSATEIANVHSTLMIAA
jgi:hypothetical protein